MHVSPGLSRKLFGSQCSNNSQVNDDSEDDDQATDLNAFGSRHKGKNEKASCEFVVKKFWRRLKHLLCNGNYYADREHLQLYPVVCLWV